MSQLTCYKLNAYGLLLLSVAVFALGIANVTIECSSSDFPPNSACWNPDLFVRASSVFFLAVGIWASIPIMLCGFGVLRVISKPEKPKEWLLSFLCLGAFFFSPLIVVFSAFNATTAMTWLNAANSVTPAPPTLPKFNAAFAIPLTSAIIGGLIHLKLLIMHSYESRQKKLKRKQAMAVRTAPAVAAPAASPQTAEVVLKPTAWHASSGPTQCTNCYSAYGVTNYGYGHGHSH